METFSMRGVMLRNTLYDIKLNINQRKFEHLVKDRYIKVRTSSFVFYDGY